VSDSRVARNLGKQTRPGKERRQNKVATKGNKRKCASRRVTPSDFLHLPKKKLM
jgi:hypothetical protein